MKVQQFDNLVDKCAIQRNNMLNLVVKVWQYYIRRTGTNYSSSLCPCLVLDPGHDLFLRLPQSLALKKENKYPINNMAY